MSPPFIQCLYAVFSYKHFFTTINYFWRLYTTFGGHKLLSAARCYFWRSCTTFDGHILLLTAIYQIWRLYITFDGYILLLALGYCYFARIQVSPAISFLCGLNTRLDFSTKLLALIQFRFSCNSIISPVNFNLSFWKHFIRNTQMHAKNVKFQVLKKTGLDIFNWIKSCYSNCNVLRRPFSDKVSLLEGTRPDEFILPSQWW